MTPTAFTPPSPRIEGEVSSAEINILTEASVWEKIRRAQEPLTAAKGFPSLPARDVNLIPADQMPPRPGLSRREGQARLLHDLANIELQALELCYRSWSEYPEAPAEFREELLGILREEAGHLKLCLEGLRELGFDWGTWPVHPALWLAVSSEDSLIDRILIVHRYLEGNGLDAGHILERRLAGVPRGVVHGIVEKIAADELAHVRFGTRWYRRFCRMQGLDPVKDFPERFARLEARIPHRIERINRKLRESAGFTGEEIDYLEARRAEWSGRSH